MINVHASLLPRYRGAAPIQRAVIAGETETGVTIMRVASELDAGPTFAVARVPIPGDATSGELEARSRTWGRALLPVVDDLAAGRAVETPQDHARATYAPKVLKAEGAIDWTQAAQAIHDLVRGPAAVAARVDDPAWRTTGPAQDDALRPASSRRPRAAPTHAGHDRPRVSGRSARGVRTRNGNRRPRAPARGAPDDDGARVPRRARRRRGRALRIVIAPARVAAFETVLAVTAGRADLPSALARRATGAR